MSESKLKKTALSFPVTFEKVEDIEGADGRFTKVRIWLMHLGENFNGSIFEKDVVDKAIPTLEYIPIVAFIEDNKFGEKDCSNHRYVITKDEKGIRRKYMGNAYGVVMSSEDNNAHYEDRLCDDGETRTFLVVDGLIWNMFEDSSEIINRDLIKNQSMELWDDGVSIEGYEDENELFHFTKFSFRAACILGDDYEPAMINSTVEVQFTMSDFVKNIQSELNDKFIAFTKMVNEKTNQGGIETMSNTDFTQTLLAQFEDISAMVRQHETFVDRWGYECSRYYAVDIQENEVIVVDAKNSYNYFGLSFTMNGDKAEIDFDSAKRKKLRYEDYEDGSSVEGTFNFGKHIEEIENTAFAKVEEANTKASDAETKVSEYEAKVSEFETAKNEIEEKFNQINAEFEEMKPKYEGYVKAEQARIEAELDAQKDAEFAKYESVLTDDTDFAAIKEKKAEMTVKEIESECAILFARKSLANANFSKSDSGNMVAGLTDTGEKDGYVATKYGYIPVR
ncbi:MAG: hypothetical protein J6R59_10790 [Paludibacteraceae bacterium]|nr:hypothetical protein [Paludibacteraceae bacterium]